MNRDRAEIISTKKTQDMTLLHNKKNQMETWQLSKEKHQIF